MAQNRTYSDMSPEELWGFLEKGVDYASMHPDELEQLAKRIDRELFRLNADAVISWEWKSDGGIGSDEEKNISAEVSAIRWLAQQREQISDVASEKYKIEFPDKFEVSVSELESMDELFRERENLLRKMKIKEEELTNIVEKIRYYQDPNTELSPLDDREQVVEGEKAKHEKSLAEFQLVWEKLNQIDNKIYTICVDCGNPTSTIEQLQKDTKTLQAVSDFLVKASMEIDTLLSKTQKEWDKGYAILTDDPKLMKQIRSLLNQDNQVIQKNFAAVHAKLEKCSQLIEIKEAKKSIMKPGKTGLKLSQRSPVSKESEGELEDKQIFQPAAKDYSSASKPAAKNQEIVAPAVEILDTTPKKRM